MFTLIPIIITLAVLLVLIGIILVFIGILRESTREESEVEAGGVVIIGPIPIVVGSNQRIAKSLLVLAIVLTVILVLIHILIAVL